MNRPVWADRLWGRARALARWWNRWGALLMTLGFLAIVGEMALRHEMWRDEIQGWLLARDAPMPWNLPRITRYEGHPWLWHLVLWLPSRLTWNPAAMQVAHVLIAAGSVFLLLRFAPFSWPVRLLMAGGYFLAYEWAVIARNYALSVLLFFAFASLYARRWRNAAWMGLALGLAGLTNIHSVIVGFAFLAALCIEYAVAFAGDFRNAKRSLKPALLGFLLAITGLGVGLRATIPPDDSGFATEWHFRWSRERYASTLERVIWAYFPLPEDRIKFWNSNRFLSEGRKPDEERPWWAVSPETRIRTAWLILLAAALFFFRRPWALFPFAAAHIGLLFFLYVKYPGSYRHAGFLFLTFFLALWISRSLTPWRLPADRGKTIMEWVERGFLAALAALLILHVQGATVAYRYDRRHAFSQSNAAAEFLRLRYPNPETRVWAGARSVQAMTVAGHLRLPSMNYLDAQREGSYMIWDKAPRVWPPPQEVVERTRALHERSGKPVVLIATQALPPSLLRRPGWTELGAFRGSITDEEFFLYEYAATP